MGVWLREERAHQKQWMAKFGAGQSFRKTMARENRRLCNKDFWWLIVCLQKLRYEVIA